MLRLFPSRTLTLKEMWCLSTDSRSPSHPSSNQLTGPCTPSSSFSQWCAHSFSGTSSPQSSPATSHHLVLVQSLRPGPTDRGSLCSTLLLFRYPRCPPRDERFFIQAQKTPRARWLARDRITTVACWPVLPVPGRLLSVARRSIFESVALQNISASARAGRPEQHLRL
jgi:hypothetical protein